MPFTFDSRVPITRIKIGRIRQCWRIPISAEINTIGHRTPRKIKAKPFSLMPPKTKLVPSAAKPNSEAKKPEIFFTSHRPLSACRKKKASAISIIINWRI